MHRPALRTLVRRTSVRYGDGVQRSFDDLGMPLEDVTFCVIDIETTGGTAADGGITEIAAARFRGGELLGNFATFTNPGSRIPHHITMLTGITQAMVANAPPPDAVLPTLLEFIGDAVVVGHNVRYDLGYLNALAQRSEHPRIANVVVDTLALARRLVRDEVPNCRLGTLADRLGLEHRPSHRALDDVLATADLLHLLLERAGRLGVRGLDDLTHLPRISGHAQAAKLRLTEDLPRRPGVYLFRDGRGDTLYVGKATNLRSRVRSYFSTDDRKKVGSLLRETERIDHVVCPTPLEAAVLEVRLIHRLEPRFNRQLKTWRRYVYLKLTAERFPRLSVVKSPREDGGLYLGPLPSRRVARLAMEAIETAVPLRRCTATPGRAPRSGPCAPAQLGVSTCPCAGSTSEDEYQLHVRTVRRGLLEDATILLAPLEAKIHALASTERFEEAAEVRDRAAALSSAIRRQLRVDALRGAGRIDLEVDGTSFVQLDHGRLARSWSVGRSGIVAVPLPLDLDPRAPDSAVPPATPGDAVPAALADETRPHPSPTERRRARPLTVGATDVHTSGTVGSVCEVNWLALGILGGLGAVVVAACVLYLIAMNRFHRRHRIEPRTPTPAPVTWLADPRSPARLHRRLVRVGRATTAVAEAHSPRVRWLRRGDHDAIARAAVDLRSAAVALDNELVRLSVMAAGVRRVALVELSANVALIERSCVQLTHLSAVARGPLRLNDEPSELSSIVDRIEHLAAAHHEVAALDASSGLRSEPTIIQRPHDRPTAVPRRPESVLGDQRDQPTDTLPPWSTRSCS